MSLSHSFLYRPDMPSLYNSPVLGKINEWETKVLDDLQEIAISWCSNCQGTVNTNLATAQSCYYLLQLKLIPQTRSTVSDHRVIAGWIQRDLEYIEYLLDHGKDLLDADTHLRNVVDYTCFKELVLSLILSTY